MKKFENAEDAVEKLKKSKGHMYSRGHEMAEERRKQKLKEKEEEQKRKEKERKE